MARMRADPIPEGFIACGRVGRAVNVGAQADAAYRTEGARLRFVWNHFLEIQIETYAVLGEFVFYHEMSRRLTVLRKANAWIGAGGAQAQKQVLRDLDAALKRCSRKASGRTGFPRFKKATSKRDSIRVYGAVATWVRLADGTITHIRLPNLPMLRVRNLVLPDAARITSVAVRMHGDGWKVSLGLIKRRPGSTSPVVDSVGVDVGLRVLAHAVNDATGFEIVADNPRPLKTALRRLKLSQRKFSRRTKGSVGRKRAAKEVARRHRRIADLRAAHHHRVSRRIVDAARTITIESLGIKGLMRTHVSASLADAAIGSLLEMIRYKSNWAQRPLTELNRWERSTGCCPDCGVIGERIPLGQSIWTCACGARHDRDRAAGRWIDRRGVEIRNSAHAEVGRQPPEPSRINCVVKRGSAGSRGGGTSPPDAPGPPSNIFPLAQSARASTR